MAKRVFLIVLDSVGIGEMPDAHLWGDGQPSCGWAAPFCRTICNNLLRHLAKRRQKRYNIVWVSVRSPTNDPEKLR